MTDQDTPENEKASEDIIAGGDSKGPFLTDSSAIEGLFEDVRKEPNQYAIWALAKFVSDFPNFYDESTPLAQEMKGKEVGDVYAVLNSDQLGDFDLPVRIPLSRLPKILDTACWTIEEQRSNMLNYAKEELKAAGWMDGGKDDMDYWMARHVLQLLLLFSLEGHSGSSAPFAINLFKRLANWKPLGPLTGEDSEWSDMSEASGCSMFQNRRDSTVFKEGKDGVAYTIDGYVFREPYVNDEGKEGTVTFTSRASRKEVVFPYNIPEGPIFIDVPRDSTPEQQLEAITKYHALEALRDADKG